VHRVARAVGNHVAENLFAQEREVTNEVQNLMPHEFIGEAQWRILDTIFCQDHAVLA
jgi:hypothetical protein